MLYELHRRAQRWIQKSTVFFAAFFILAIPLVATFGTVNAETFAQPASGNLTVSSPLAEGQVEILPTYDIVRGGQVQQNNLSINDDNVGSLLELGEQSGVTGLLYSEASWLSGNVARM